MACGLAPIRRSPFGRQRGKLGPAARRRRRTAPRGGRSASTPRAARGARGCRAGPASGTWWERKVPSAGQAVDDLRARSSPSGVRRTIIGHAGRSVTPSARAARWISAISSATSSSVAASCWCTACGSSPVDEPWRVAVALHQRAQLVLRDAGQDGGVGDLVAVEVQDRQHGAVARRVEELVGVPAGGQRAGLGLAVADRRSRRAGRGCRTPRRRRAPARSRARRPRGSSRASRARRGWGCRRGTRTGETAAAALPRRGRCAGRPRCRSPRGRCWRPAPGRRGPGPVTKITSRSRARITRLRWA